MEAESQALFNVHAFSSLQPLKRLVDLAETGNSRRRGVGLLPESRNGVMNNLLMLFENVICNLTVFFDREEYCARIRLTYSDITICS